MTIASEISRLTQAKSDLKTAIIAKGGSLTTETLDGYAAAVDNLPTGGDTPTSGDYKVRFIDYDGTVLKEEWVNSGNAATPPSNPSHAGLTFQEWNYDSTDLSNITSDLDVGATYITTSGATELDIRLTTVSGLSPTLYFSKSDTSTLTIDWGDGSDPDTSTTSGNQNISHTYSVAGDYTISLSLSSGSGTYSLGNGSTSSTVIGGITQVYRNTLIACRIGNKITTIGHYAFYYCFSMRTVTIPSTVTSISSWNFVNNYSLISAVIPAGVIALGYEEFKNCYALSLVSLPDSILYINSSTFYACYSLASIILPDGVTSFDGSNFQNCYSLKKVETLGNVSTWGGSTFRACYSMTSITIPSNATSIGFSIFYNCYSILEYIINPTVPPTLSGVNAFNNINTVCKIYVPDASVSDYKEATNWSTYADYIYPMSERGV